MWSSALSTRFRQRAARRQRGDARNARRLRWLARALGRRADADRDRPRRAGRAVHRLAPGDAGRAMAADKAMSRFVAIGLGCRAGVKGDAIAALARRSLAEFKAPDGERRLFTLAAKADEPGLLGGGARLIGAPLTPLPLDVAEGAGRAEFSPFGRCAIAFRRAERCGGRGARRRWRGRPSARTALRRGRRDLRHRALRDMAMTVHFIGAGPGAPDLITLRGRDLIARSPVCLYAGSLVPRALLDHCPPGARNRRHRAARSRRDRYASRGDPRGQGRGAAAFGRPSVWSAMGEQMRRLDGGASLIR